MLFYKDLGSGVPILFIHPPGMGHKVFRYQQSLSTKYRVLLMDLNGHGQSDVRTTTSVEQFVLDVKSVLDHGHIEQAVICGYSAGGMIAQAFALAFPNRTLRLVLAGGFPKVSSRILDAEFRLGMWLIKRNPEKLAEIIAKGHSQMKQFQLELQHYMLKANRHVWYQFYQATYHYDCSHSLHNLMMPILLVYGKREVWVKKHLSMYEVCPNCTLYEIPQSFHQTPTKTPLEFNQAIDYFVRVEERG
ncbi:alpha/beta fold hydrolase [Pontibacillus litoralis]|uniref:AB hydrolase-1 domain-containing protein n=1 Tax=Pontibacillus litoralis JSM 072002 TaxID=1385512 RepID=A0A0A5G271_9BACI|nr:alpha/beta hydrolase [Pontibacillus litoralis]KGX86129.1 hypothetical protein N784_06075 [Pontibacillus litoralis JSM 072002]